MNFLIDWVIKHLRDGYSQDQILRTAKAFSWDHDDVVFAIESAKKRIYMGYFYRLSAIIGVVFISAIFIVNGINISGFFTYDPVCFASFVGSNKGRTVFDMSKCNEIRESMECSKRHSNIFVNGQEFIASTYCSNGRNTLFIR